jgi:hypothetical protein
MKKPLIHISTLTGKMEGIPSISTNCLSNANCKKLRKVKGSICERCYAFNALAYRKNLRLAMERNSQILSRHELTEDEIPFLNLKFMRYESHSDLINELHLKNLCRITSKNHWCNFTLWTKNYSLTESYFSRHDKPSNLKLVYSSLKIGVPLNKENFKYCDKVFTVYLKGELTGAINCQRKCIKCLRCYSHTDRTLYINEELNLNKGRKKEIKKT